MVLLSLLSDNSGWQLCTYISDSTYLSMRASCTTGVGFSTGSVALNRLPGWETHSYGYHGDDGMAFHSCGTGKPYGPVYATGM